MEELDPITIAVPIKAKMERFCYGYFMGPCYLYYASAMGIRENGNSIDQAVRRLEIAIRKEIEGSE